MLNAKELFASTYFKEGGIFNTANAHPQIRDYLEHFRELALNNIDQLRNNNVDSIRSMPNVHFDYISNVQLNAFATFVEPFGYLIGMNLGAVMVMSDIYMRLLCYNNLFLNIGNASGEIFSEPTLKNYYSNFGDLVDSRHQVDEYSIPTPNDIERVIYASHLQDLALKFLIHHEITHIRNGHVSYILNEFGNGKYDELNTQKIGNNDFLLFQTLEMDADAIGISQVLGLSRRIVAGQYVMEPPFDKYYKNYDRILIDFAIAVLTLFKIIEAEMDLNEMPTTHPHPIVRRTMVIAAIEAYVSKYLSEYIPPGKIVNKMWEVNSYVEKCFETLTGVKSKEYLNIDKYDFVGHSKVVNQKWREIRPVLLKYSYGLLWNDEANKVTK